MGILKIEGVTVVIHVRITDKGDGVRFDQGGECDGSTHAHHE